MKYAFIQRHRRVWPISVQCRVLRVSVAGYHEHLIRRGRVVQRRHLESGAGCLSVWLGFRGGIVGVPGGYRGNHAGGGGPPEPPKKKGPKDQRLRRLEDDRSSGCQQGEDHPRNGCLAHHQNLPGGVRRRHIDRRQRPPLRTSGGRKLSNQFGLSKSPLSRTA